MESKTKDVNRERLLRVIRGLQLLQRTNPPKSTLAKAAGKALIPLLDEQAALPPEASPLTAGQGS